MNANIGNSIKDGEGMDVSIIIPLYKGQKHIEHLLQMINENYLYVDMGRKYSLEVIFVNDFPKEDINLEVQEKNFSVKVYTNTTNQGIHQSRVNGIEQATGNYIIMLDQDDEIDSTYLASQLQKIGEADAVVCNGKNKNRLIYGNECVQEHVKDLESYIWGNKIISPGQVLLKKSAIPKQWKENILKNNGADDYFLWLLMLSSGCKFAINPEVLYVHTMSTDNTSNNSVQMNKSVLEMVDYLRRKEILDVKQIDTIYERHSKLSGKYFQYTKLLDMWMNLMERNVSLEKVLINEKYTNIAIYGMGILGKHLEIQLRNSKINVKYIIDRNKKAIENGKETISVGDEMNSVDVIVVTPIDEYAAIRETLEQDYTCDICSLEYLIYKAAEEIW